MASVPAELPVRRAPVKRFPYHVVYLETSEAIRILAFAHDSRRPGYWYHRARDHCRDTLSLNQFFQRSPRGVIEPVGDIDGPGDRRHVGLGPVDSHRLVNRRIEISDGHRSVRHIGSIFVAGTDDAAPPNAAATYHQRPAVRPMIPSPFGVDHRRSPKFARN